MEEEQKSCATTTRPSISSLEKLLRDKMQSVILRPKGFSCKDESSRIMNHMLYFTRNEVSDILMIEAR